ncbi:hypothetical protein [Streptomyces boncukensis]|uniref:Integral membrane protein n=1 Tax=Streptomyces boncukensis TaxID=2711219 RepID=A0A6G4WYF0_9ACTN|nr:hypothetical protein [Streptomyces boncukensis]NGO69892.1 hypothetical protein [Streptomyces boncukensis]
MDLTVKAGEHQGLNREQWYLRWTAIFGLAPLPLLVLPLSLGKFPYPANNADGQEKLNYILPHYRGEVGVICWLGLTVALMMFSILLAFAYITRARRVTASGVILIASASTFAAMNLIVSAAYAALPLLSRGKPAFGTGPADYTLVTFGWVTSNLTYLMSAPMMGMMWAAIAVANRTHPLLPRGLGGWCAVLIAVNANLWLASLFVRTGNWSPGSALQVVAQMGPILVWTTAVSVFLLARGIPKESTETRSVADI